MARQLSEPRLSTQSLPAPQDPKVPEEKGLFSAPDKVPDPQEPGYCTGCGTDDPKVLTRLLTQTENEK